MWFWCSTCSNKPIQWKKQLIVNRNCLAKRRILTSNVRDLVGDSWGLDIKSIKYTPLSRKHWDFRRKMRWGTVQAAFCQLSGSWFFSCFTRVFNVYFLLFPGFLLVFCWFSPGLFIACPAPTAGDGTRADRLRRQLLHPRGARVAWREFRVFPMERIGRP